MATMTDDQPARSWSVGRIAVVGVVLALVLFWIWILAGGPAKANPDHLSDTEWVAFAQRTCLATREQIDALPGAELSPDSVARADVLDQANDKLGAMLDELGSRPPADPDDAELVELWLADYRQYLGDRRDYARRLRTDASARMLVEEKNRDPLDTVIDLFAMPPVNDMEACAVPGDLA